MRILYIFECKQPDWQNFIPMPHIQPVTSPLVAQKKLKKISKTHSFAVWRVRRYQRVEEE